MIKPYNEKISVLQQEIDDKSIQIAKLNSEITKLKTQNDSLASETETKEKANLKQIDTLSNINVSQSKLYEQMESTIKMKEEFEQKRGEMLKAKDKELDEVYEKLEVADKKLKQVTSELKQFKNIIDLIDVDNLDAGDELNNAESSTEEGNQSKINIKELEHKLMLKIKKINDEKDEAVTTKEMWESQIEGLQDQIEILNNLVKEYEGEIESLKDQLNQSELNDKQDESIRIEKDKNIESLLFEKSQISDRLSKTLDEYNELSAKHDGLVVSLQKLQKEKDELEGIEENMKHIKGTLITFLQNTPFTYKENESVLAVVYSMLGFSSQEIKLIENQRKNIQPKAKQDDKASFFGMFGRKK